ncbi:MAG: hypothetical protein AB7G93_21865 [Bdellovibrionales bacterium]
MIRLLAHLFLQEYRFQYRSWWHAALFVMTCVITLTIYWFTSEAIHSLTKLDERWAATSYFEFLLLGELILLFPLAACDATVRAVRFAASEGLLEDFFLHPGGPLKPLWTLSLSLLLPNLVYLMVTPILASAMFGYSLEWPRALGIAGLILTSLPLFMGVGWIAAGVFLRFGRGQGVLSQVLYASSVLAGAYFPLSAMPERLSQVVLLTSPFAALLQMCREVAVGREIPFIPVILAFMGVGLLTLALGALALNWASDTLRRGNWPQFLHP